MPGGGSQGKDATQSRGHTPIHAHPMHPSVATCAAHNATKGGGAPTILKGVGWGIIISETLHSPQLRGLKISWVPGEDLGQISNYNNQSLILQILSPRGGGGD